MKIFVVITAAALCTPVLALGQNQTTFEGQMDCEVQSNSVTEIQDGRVTIYSHYANSFEVGDTLIFEYATADGRYLDIRLVDRPRDRTIYSKRIYLNGYYKIDGGDGISLGIKTDWVGPPFVYFGRDTIEVASPNSGYSLLMGRYYRSDWQGIVSGFNGGDVHTFAFDCRTVGSDNIQATINALKELEWLR